MNPFKKKKHNHEHSTSLDKPVEICSGNRKIKLTFKQLVLLVLLLFSCFCIYKLFIEDADISGELNVGFFSCSAEVKEDSKTAENGK